MTNCECSEPGDCPRHGIRKSEHRHLLCQTDEGYFQMWEEGRGPGQKKGHVNPSRGLGDRIHNWIKWAAKFLPGFLRRSVEEKSENCGKCQKRQDALNQLFPKKSGQLVAVGVTTAYRSVSFLPETLASLQRAGFVDVTVFAEKGAIVPKGNHRTIQHKRVLGAWKNWRQSIHDLIALYPDAHTILIVQDDVVFSRGIRPLLNGQFPDGAVAISLYSPTQYEGRRSVVGMNRVSAKFMVGACALAFPRKIAEEIVNSRESKTWPGTTVLGEVLPDIRKAAIDVFVGHWMKSRGLRCYFVLPSLAQHIAPEKSQSSLGHGQSGDNSRRVSRTFIGEDALATDVFHSGFVDAKLRDKAAV